MQTVKITYTCDRCGKEYENPPTTSFDLGSVGAKDGIFRPKDLCRECADNLIKWYVERRNV